MGLLLHRRESIRCGLEVRFCRRCRRLRRCGLRRRNMMSLALRLCTENAPNLDLYFVDEFSFLYYFVNILFSFIIMRTSSLLILFLFDVISICTYFGIVF